MISYRVLEPAEASRYRGFTFPAYRHLLDGLGTPAAGQVGSLAVGASLLGRPTGLALAGLPPTDSIRDPELLSIYVGQSARQKGIGSALLERLEDELAQRGYTGVTTSYMCGKPSIPYVERMLKSAGWAKPATRTFAIRFTRDEARNVPWFGKYSLGQGYEIFPWAEVTEAERRELRRSHEETGWISEDLLPWKFDAEFEPLTSLGLRLDGRVVGWVINHVIAPDTVRMACVFVRRDLQRLGKILPVLSESLDLLQQTPYIWVSATTRVHYPGMIGFFKRWCGPWATFLDETRESAKELAPPPEGQP